MSDDAAAEAEAVAGQTGATDATGTQPGRVAEDAHPAPTDNSAPRTYKVRHVTTYEYELARDSAYERGRMTPRDSPSQSVRDTETIVEPDPDVISDSRDVYGNPSYYIEVRSPHTMLRITKRSIVDVAWPKPDLAHLNQWTVAEAAQLLAEAAPPIDVVEAAEFALPSPQVEITDAVADYAAKYLPADAPFGDSIFALTQGIFTDFTYKNGVTNVRTTLTELLELGAGVCQDFAQLAIGCLRHVGLPARYVSGYIETQPPPGKPKLEGSDASHAWTSVLAPDGTWVDIDPTNNQFADSRYIVSAWGRDFTDVSPLRGIVYGESTTSTLNVGVDVIRVPEGEVASW
ncbi:MAG: transglutaminase family protein [Pseudoclavibacter sp.]